MTYVKIGKRGKWHMLNITTRCTYCGVPTMSGDERIKEKPDDSLICKRCRKLIQGEV